MKTKKNCVILFVLTIILLGLCGCEKKEIKKANCYNRFERESTIINIETPNATAVDILCINDKRMIFKEYEKDFFGYQEEAKTRGAIYEYDFENGNRTKINPEDDFEDSDILTFASENQLIGYDYHANRITFYDENRKNINGIALDDVVFGKEQEEREIISNVLDIRCDKDYVYIIGDNRIGGAVLYVLDKNFNGVYFINAKNDWNPYIMEDNSIRFSDETEIPQYSYKTQSGTLEKLVKVSGKLADYIVNSRPIYGVGGYDYCYYIPGPINKHNQDNTNVAMGVQNGKVYQLFDFEMMNLRDADYACSDGNGGFRFIYEDDTKYSIEIVHLLPCEKEQSYSLKNNKTVVKIGCLSIPNGMEWAVNDFNSFSKEYYLEMITYLDRYDEWSDAVKHLHIDCVTGHKIDAVFLDEMDRNVLINQGVVCDLTGYLEQSRVLENNTFTNSFLNSVMGEDGKIYSLYPTYSVVGVAYEEKVQFDDLTKYNPVVEPNKLFFGEEEESSALYSLLQFSGATYVDADLGEMHLREKPFISMLELLKKQSDVSVEHYDSIDKFCNKETSSFFTTIDYPYEYNYYNELFQGKLQLSNSGADGVVIGQKYGELSVLSKSENKEAIYQFYDFIFEPHYYHANFFWNLPVFEHEWDIWKEEMLATEAFVDEYGETHLGIEITYGMGETERTISRGSLSEEQVDQVIGILKNPTYINPMRNELMNIIVEEAQAYFDNQKSLEEVIDLMERRLINAMEE